MKNSLIYFLSRKFFDNFPNFLWEKLYSFFISHSSFEIADLDALKTFKEEKKIPVFLSERNSVIEQFILNGFFISNQIAIPSHSFGSKTILSFKLKEFIEFFRLFFTKTNKQEEKIVSVYATMESASLFVEKDSPFNSLFFKISHKGLFVIPVTFLWNKSLSVRKKDWLKPFLGKYNFWSTFSELFLFLIGRRTLTIRIGLPVELQQIENYKHFYATLNKILKTEKTKIVGVAIKNWFELRTETLAQLALDEEFQLLKAEKNIKEIETKFSPFFAEKAAKFTKKLLKKQFSKIVVNNEELDNLRKLVSNHKINVVFVPTHKSYFDFFILFSILYNKKITLPLVVSGNNLSFFPLGTFLRKTGVFFIRRSLKNSNFYRKVFFTYLKNIISSGYNIEFFPEGGRSRSGRVRNARTGILKMLSKIKKETKRRIYIIPISISYEKLKEIENYELEIKYGKEEEKKNFFTKIKSLFTAKYGPAYIRFGTPMYLGNKITSQFVEELSYRQEKESIITFSSVVASFLLINRNLSGLELTQKTLYLAKILKQQQNLHISKALEMAEINIPRLIHKLSNTKKIIYLADDSDNFMLSSVAEKEFLFYKNTLAFALVPFLIEFTDNQKIKEFFNNFFNILIKGFKKDTLPVKIETYPNWFKYFIFKFFVDYVKLLTIILEILVARETPSGFSSTKKIVIFLKRKLEKYTILFSEDDIFEIVLFIKKQGAISGTSILKEKSEQLLLISEEAKIFLNHHL